MMESSMSALSNMAAASHLWLLSSWKVANVNEEQNVFYLNLVKFK